MESDLQKCLLLLNQTVALAKYLSLNVVLGIETSSSKKCWSTTSKNFRDDLLSNELTFSDNDVWLESGKIIDQHVLKKDELLRGRAGCLAVVTEPNNNHCPSGLLSSQQSSNDEIFSIRDIKHEIIQNNVEEGLECVAHADNDTDNEPHGSSIIADLVPVFENVSPSSRGVARSVIGAKRKETIQIVKVESVDENSPRIKDVSSQCESNRNSSRYQPSEGDEDRDELSHGRAGETNTLDVEPIIVVPINQCQICGVSFASIEEGTNHYHEAHLQCVECSKYFGCLRTLKLHVDNVHRGLKPHKCSKCEKRFGTSADKCLHEKKRHKIKPRMKTNPFKKVEKKAKSKNIPRAKAASAIPNDVDDGKSDELNRKFGGIGENPNKVNEIITPRENSEEIFQDPLSQEDINEMHGADPSENVVPNYVEPKTVFPPDQCRPCDMKFASIEERGNQYHQAHLQCNECGKVFKRAQSLKAHVKIFHRGLKPYQCSECGKKFYHSSDRLAHEMKIHKMNRQNKNDPLEKIDLKMKKRNSKTKYAENGSANVKIRDDLDPAGELATSGESNIVSFVREKTKLFNCVTCNYTSGRKHDLARHIATKRHHKMTRVRALAVDT